MTIQSTFNGYVWSQWFGGNLTTLATLFAAILGSGSPLSGSARGVTFSLALPVSRKRWLTTRTALGLAELLVLILVPSLLIVLLAPIIGQNYDLTAAVVHSLGVFIVGAAFFACALLLSTIFSGVLRPLLITCAIAFVIGMLEALFVQRGVFATMAAESYFRGGAVPLIGWLVSIVVTAGLLYAAARNVEAQDF
jgi:ABC-type transport system involved in multi-copper enzyme maturation permease subunit